MCATRFIVVYIVVVFCIVLVLVALVVAGVQSSLQSRCIVVFAFFRVVVLLFLLSLVLSVVSRHRLLLCHRPSFVVIRLPPSSRVAYHGVLLFRVVLHCFALFRVVVVGLVLVHVLFSLGRCVLSRVMRDEQGF